MFLHYKAKEKKDLKKYRPCGRCAACGNDEIHIFLLKQNEKKSKKIFENVAKITKNHTQTQLQIKYFKYI